MKTFVIATMCLFASASFADEITTCKLLDSKNKPTQYSLYWSEHEGVAQDLVIQDTKTGKVTATVSAGEYKVFRSQGGGRDMISLQASDSELKVSLLLEVSYNSVTSTYAAKGPVYLSETIVSSNVSKAVRSAQCEFLD